MNEMRKARTYRLKLGVWDFISLPYYGESAPCIGDEVEIKNVRDDEVFMGRVARIVPARREYIVEITNHVRRLPERKPCDKIE